MHRGYRKQFFLVVYSEDLFAHRICIYKFICKIVITDVVVHTNQYAKKKM